jgi:hypothetical protein
LRSSGGLIEPEIRLVLTLRLLACASYLDTMMLFGISRCACYAIFHDTTNVVLSRADMRGFRGLKGGEKPKRPLSAKSYAGFSSFQTLESSPSSKGDEHIFPF